MQFLWRTLLPTALLSPRSFQQAVCTAPALSMKAVCAMKTIQLVGGEIISHHAHV